jgi:hypothetical protein
MIESLNSAKVLEQIKAEDGSVDVKKLDQILQAKLANEKPAADVTAAEKAVWNLKAETIDAYLNNVIKSASYYTDMIRVLPTIQ